MTLTAFVIIITAAFSLCEFVCQGSDDLAASWTVSDAVLPTATRNVYTVYNESFNSDCIWVFGGVHNPTYVGCYNITNDSLSEYDILTSGGYTHGRPGSTIIDNIITNNGELHSYDIADKNEATLMTFNLGSSSHEPC